VAFFFGGDGGFSDSDLSSPDASDFSVSPGSSEIRFCLGGALAGYSSTTSVLFTTACFFELI
jgi:hypothetical protein